jgi:5-hydroxyisourate hydrolase
MATYLPSSGRPVRHRVTRQSINKGPHIMNKFIALGAMAASIALPSFAGAAEISTHVLDLANGKGGANVPVVLLQRDATGRWVELARAQTNDNGRVASFGGAGNVATGTYKLSFDMTNYPAAGAQRFFPEIDIVFSVNDPAAHFHVPVVVSPFGYSTYRGN